jgi:hypothetical protein
MLKKKINAFHKISTIPDFHTPERNAGRINIKMYFKLPTIKKKRYWLNISTTGLNLKESYVVRTVHYVHNFLPSLN